MYSGSQIVTQVLYNSASESLYKFPNSFVVESELRNTLYKPIETHNINIHLLVPYISQIAFNKLSNLENKTCLNIIKYNKYIVNQFMNVLSVADLDKLYSLYNMFYQANTDILIPIFFDHKIADSISTIELILIKGQVLDNKDKQLIFIDECDIYNNQDPNYIFSRLYCPVPPYHKFEKILKEQLK